MNALERPTVPGDWPRLDHAEITRLLPHRYPFLLVDRAAVNPDPDRWEGFGWKGVTVNEPYFPGHFPGTPLVPGVLLIEAIAQVAALSVLWHQDEGLAGRIMYLLGVENARIRATVTPGTCLMIHAWVDRRRHRFIWFRGRIWDGDRVVAEARISSTLAENA